MSEQESVLIATPSTTHIWAHNNVDMIGLTNFSSNYYNIEFLNIQGPMLPIMRDGLATYAIKNGHGWILFVDSDMRFPADGLKCLMERGKHIIGCNAAIKDQELAKQGKRKPVIEKDIFGTDMMTHPDELAKVEKIGMAFTLINLDVFNHLSLPYFYIDYGENGAHWGEDTSFCADIQTFGYDIWCDNILSDKIGHLGEFEYKLKD